ncbi:SDR family NAD(P)-dependent oxidoreductase [Actinomadura kijaniata]|uniref:SDR family NAD(P)-dependent oxidoreductase n=1 Tax=Actinomadura kijaniata TaxID=46161 RepID=UPI003F1D612A
MNRPPEAGRTALVTGATRGLGLVIAQTLGAAGHRVLVNYAHRDGDAARAVRSLADRGVDSRPLRADIGDPVQLHRALDQVADEYGHLDVLVHNAVRFSPMPTGAPDPAACAEDMAVAYGPLLGGVARLSALMTPRTGRIVAVSSTGARRVVPHYLSLGLAKAALESLVRYLAVEFAGRGVTVNAVAPGRIADPGRDAGDRTAAMIAARTPAGRLTTARDVADVVDLLCRPEAGWIHGQVITADGGLGLLP